MPSDVYNLHATTAPSALRSWGDAACTEFKNTVRLSKYQIYKVVNEYIIFNNNLQIQYLKYIVALNIE